MRRGTPLVLAVMVAACSGPITAPTPRPTTTADLPSSSVAPASATPTASPAVSSKVPATPSSLPSGAPDPTLAQMIGQKLVIRMDGLTPTDELLGRIRRGEVGGVILFGSNISTQKALLSLTATLHDAAVRGGRPRLLIAVDQEGGAIKRIPWAPPTISPPDIGRTGRASVAREQGSMTGVALHGLGIDVDFAPVADVPTSTASFMYREGRTFSFDAGTTATLADAFASGLEGKAVLPTMKHFPGLGSATHDTDTTVVTIDASKRALASGLLPYRTAIGRDIPLIMLSNATYVAYDASDAAGWSHAISVDLLRDELGFTGVTITDSLDGTAHARGLSSGSLAIRAARAGTDMILVTGSEASTRAAYDALVAEATEGAIPRAELRASYDRIIALKAGFD